MKFVVKIYENLGLGLILLICIMPDWFDETKKHMLKPLSRNNSSNKETPAEFLLFWSTKQKSYIPSLDGQDKKQKIFPKLG